MKLVFLIGVVIVTPRKIREQIEIVALLRLCGSVLRFEFRHNSNWLSRLAVNLVKVIIVVIVITMKTNSVIEM